MVGSSTQLVQEDAERRSHSLAAAVVLLVIIGAVLLYYPTLYGFLTSTAASLGMRGTTVTTTEGAGPPVSVYSPVIKGGVANVSYPVDFASLASYALDTINKDRAKFGLGPVSLSPIVAGQQHADSMLYFGYFSHWDTQGFKPYMRYTLLGGVGAVQENIAYEFWSGPHFTTTNSVEAAISSLEFSMMYNDSICCNNGHRDNILNPLHNRVSIGIAYNTTRLFFVEDFENFYVNMTWSVSPGYEVSFTGVPVSTSVKGSSIAVFYDPTPEPMSVLALNTGPREYTPGTLIGGVMQPCSYLCPYFSNGITVYASRWVYTPSQLNIIFSLSKFIQQNGPGVYTLYMLTGSSTDTAITSISIFVR